MMTISEQCQTRDSPQHVNSSLNIPASPVKASVIPEQHSMPPLTRKIMPLGGFFVAFLTVMTILILYTDNTLTRHSQFKVNMSENSEYSIISQDNPVLIKYIQEMHIKFAVEKHHKHVISQNALPEDTKYVVLLLNNKTNGIFIEAGAYNDEKTSKTEYLERNYNWTGLLIQPDPRHYFKLLAHNRKNSKASPACLSSMPYPREIILHQDGDGDSVKINNLLSNSIEPDWLVTRVKCFPLYSFYLAMNVTKVDYLSLNVGGTELQVLETIPFERFNADVIGIQLNPNNLDELGTIKKFLATKKYKFMQGFSNESVIFMRNRIMI